MSTVKLQQFYADEVLRMIERIDPFAIIAGGAARDWYLGREATDLDVYFHPSPSWTLWTLQCQLEAFGFKLKKGEHHLDFQERRSYYGKNPYITSLFNPIGTAMKVQLMVMSKPTFQSVLPQFPLNLCMGWYKNRKVYAEPDLKDAVEDKKIVRVNSKYRHNDPYITKIRNKFPDYKYVSSPRDTLTGTDREKADCDYVTIFPSFEEEDNEWMLDINGYPF